MLFRPKKNLKVVWITLKIQGNFFKCSDVKVSKDGNVELTRQWNGGGERLNLPSQSRLWTGMDMAGEADTSGRYSGLAGQVSCLRAPHWPRLHTSSHSPVGVGGQQAPCVNWPLRRRGPGGHLVSPIPDVHPASLHRVVLPVLPRPKSVTCCLVAFLKSPKNNI